MTWSTTRLIISVAVIQIFFLILVGLSSLGHDIQFLRQFIAYIYFIFIPGVLILRILKIHQLGFIKTLLYSVGLSLAFAMFLGLLIDMVYPHIGILKPISIAPLITTWAIATTLLCVAAYKRDREFVTYCSIDLSILLSPAILCLFLLPLLVVIGTYLMNFHQSNTLLIILLCIISLFPVLVVSGKINQKVYPFATVMIGLALLLHYSLVSQYLAGADDIHREYYLQKLVLQNSLWETSVATDYNAMLSVTILGPLYSLFLDVGLIWVLKVVYPLTFALVPLAIFQIFRTQTNDKIAFLAAFFFMSSTTFFGPLTGAVRQQVAELFLLLSVMLFLEKQIPKSRIIFLSVVFGFSIVVSHYSLAYLYMFYLVIAIVFLQLLKSERANRIWIEIVDKASKSVLRRKEPNRQAEQPPLVELPSFPNLSFAFLVIAIGITWFVFTASGDAFSHLVHVGQAMWNGMFGEFLKTESRDMNILRALGLAQMPGQSIEWGLARISQSVVQLFIVIGVIQTVLNWRKSKFHIVFIAMSIVSMLILALSIIVPYFSDAMNMARTYHITLLFLSVFFILGGISVIRFILKRSVKTMPWTSTRSALSIVIIFVLVPYFLFQTGVFFEIRSNITHMSMAINPWMDEQRFTTEEMESKDWLFQYGKRDNADADEQLVSDVYADGYGRGLMLENCLIRESFFFEYDTLWVPENAYIYLREYNVNDGMVARRLWEENQTEGPWELTDSPFYDHVLIYKNKIYANGGSEVYQ